MWGEGIQAPPRWTKEECGPGVLVRVISQGDKTSTPSPVGTVRCLPERAVMSKMNWKNPTFRYTLWWNHQE